MTQRKANASVKALRKLLSNNSIDSVPTVEMQAHLNELAGDNDRLQAVVCGTIVDDTLAKLIQTLMYNGPGILFDINQALSTFSSKIHLAYSLGLIDHDVRRNADYIREIRNVFAHRLRPTYFRTPEVAAVCKLLKIGKFDADKTKNYRTSMRSRFIAAAVYTAQQIATRGKAEMQNLRERLENDEPPLPPASLP
jgi:site-specific recombinase